MMCVNKKLLYISIICSVLSGCSYQDEEMIIKPEVKQEEEISKLEEDVIDNFSQKKDLLVGETEYTYIENPSMDLLEKNSDYIGWITVNNTIIDEPIVRTNDNEFYLDHDFNRESNKYGAVFMDYRNLGFEFSKNTILYGHNAKNSKRFGPLEEMLDELRAREVKTITIQTLFDEIEYDVFAFYFDDAEPKNIRIQFTGEESFNRYIEEALSKSIYNYEIEVTELDQILTLVTCSYDIDDGRYFLHAKKVEANHAN